MAAFNFPNSPSVNDTHTENSVSFKWDGTVWKRVSGTGAQGPTGAQGNQGTQGNQGQTGAQAYISDAAPSSGLTNGDLWWDSDSGDFSIYYDDGSGSPSAQWVEVGSTGPTGPTGAQGAQGHQGSAGAQGAQGSAGAQGAQGSAGAQGAQGSAGSATLSNNADNRVITGGSGTNLNAEANMTFNGSTLTLTPGSSAGNITSLVLGRTSSAPAAQTTAVVAGGIPVSGVPGIMFGSTNTNLPAIGFQTPNSSNGHIVFSPKGSEKIRIDDGGTLVIGDSASATPAGQLHLYRASNDPYMYIQRGSGDSVTTIGGIFWKNSGNNLGLVDVQSQDVNDAVMRFYTMGGGTLSERFRLRNNNTNGVALITSPASGDTLNLQTDAGGGHGMILGTDVSGNTNIYIKNNSSGHFGFQYRHGSTTQLEITSGGKVQLPTTNSTRTYLNTKNIGVGKISTSDRTSITDVGAVAYDYELDDVMVYRNDGYWSGIDNAKRRGRIRTQNLRVALNFDIGHNPQDNALLAATVFHNLDYGSSFAISGSVSSTLRTSSGLDNGPYWNRQMAGGNVGSNFIVADLGGNATTQQVSACCWYKSQSNDSEGTGSGGSYGPAVALFGDTRNSVWGGFGITSRKPDFNSSNNVHNIATSAPSVVDGSWHHIVYTYDGPNADLKIYVDGTLYLTNNSVNCSSNVRYDRIAGHYNYTYTTYPHNMGNVLIYDRIISADDVKGIYYARTFYRDTLH